MIEKDWTTAAGYRAVVLWFSKRNHYCGYVGLPPGHPLYKCGYSQSADCLVEPAKQAMEKPVGKRGAIPLLAAVMSGRFSPTPEHVFDVHGSLTYANGGNGYPVEGDEWWLGFDCGHANDSPEKCTLAYCEAECESLAAQIRAAVAKAEAGGL